MFFKKTQQDISLKALTVNKNRCPQNHSCPSVKVCPVGALSQNGFQAPAIDLNKCIKCGKCVRFCPMKALTFKG
nr:4Fe-4S binding protein [uncultured Aminipila sp.]